MSIPPVHFLLRVIEYYPVLVSNVVDPGVEDLDVVFSTWMPSVFGLNAGELTKRPSTRTRWQSSNLRLNFGLFSMLRSRTVTSLLKKNLMSCSQRQIDRREQRSESEKGRKKEQSERLACLPQGCHMAQAASTPWVPE
jgi:hypothetical protein